MAPVIWGLDLAEIKWSKFKNSNMWNTEYHLRRTKFIVYQCALIFCVVSESLGTDVLSNYLDGQQRVGTLSGHTVQVHNNDYVGAGAYNIFAGVFVAFIFGAAFFFDLFWPERKESKGVRVAWKVCGVLAVIFHLGAALTITIITATHQAYITGNRPGQGDEYWWSQYSKHDEAPLDYKHNGRAIAAVVFAWLGWCSVVPSCILLFITVNREDKGIGSKSTHARRRDQMRFKAMRSTKDNKISSGSDNGPVDIEKSASTPIEPPQQPDLALPRHTLTDEETSPAAAAEDTVPSPEPTR